MKLGEEVFLLLTLMDEPQKIAVQARWCGLPRPVPITAACRA
jgi:Tfp pilus assembly protein PilZ